MTVETLKQETGALLAELGVDRAALSGDLDVRSPIDGSVIAAVQQDDRGDLDRMVAAAERAFLVEKLRENGWNISKTAEALDTPRSNLYKKLEQYGIKQEVDG